MDPVLFSSRRHDWGTPAGLFGALHSALDFKVDLAASKANALLPKYLTERQDALTRRWAKLGPCWLNPPYSRAIASWVDKCASESLIYGAKVCLLIPARTDTAAWHSHILCAGGPIVALVRGRLRFAGAEGPAPFPSALVFWGWDSDELEDAFAGRGFEHGWRMAVQPGRFWRFERMRSV